MKNILAIDYGRKRWGLAFCDELRIVLPIPAATQPTYKERLAFFESVLATRRIDTLVLGLPLTLEGEKTEMSKEVERFKSELGVYKLPIFTVDEALTSYSAEAMMVKPKVKKGRLARDGKLDSHSAALILEEFLNTWSR
jgi:putative Holliday junction resolvase